jgi:DNA-binding transcriptional regulator YdaS (Cro superfamily)
MSKKPARMTKSQLKKSIECIKGVSSIVGSQRKLAIILKIQPQNVTHWVHGRYYVAVNHIYKLVELSNDKYQPYDFRPDVFPDFNKKVDVTKV